MAFPSSPTNGQTTVLNNVSYVYDSAIGAWNVQGSVAAASPVASVSGKSGVVVLTAADIGAGTFPGTLTIPTAIITTGNISNLYGLGTSVFTGAATFSSTIGVSGAASLAAVSATTGTFSSTLGVTGATTLGSTLAVSGTMAVTGAATLSSTLQSTSIGVGTAPSGTAGEGRFTNAITAYYSDERLKTKVKTIEHALDKIDQLTGFLYVENDTARSFGFNNPNLQPALSAQDVNRVQPEVVKPAPFDIAQREDGTEYSKSGENYLTVDYAKLIPLLVEGIKELRQELNNIKQQLK